MRSEKCEVNVAGWVQGLVGGGVLGGELVGWGRGLVGRGAGGEK